MKPLVHWEGASCILAKDYDGTPYADHATTKETEKLTCPVCHASMEMNKNDDA